MTLVSHVALAGKRHVPVVRIRTTRRDCAWCAVSTDADAVSNAASSSPFSSPAGAQCV